MVTFSELRPEIEKAIDAKMNQWVTSIKKFILIDGFINIPLQMEFTGGLVIGWPSLPIVSCYNDQTTEVHFFALKALLPNVEV